MTTRITVSLPDELAEQVQQLADEHRIPSVSGFFATAAAEKLTRAQQSRRWLDERLAEIRTRDPEGYDRMRAESRAAKQDFEAQATAR
jgi:metal-responsive CopG/Arc/MetJ family transcriptional regulator